MNITTTEIDNELIVNIDASHISEHNKDKFIQYKIKCLIRNTNKKKSNCYCYLKKINTHYPEFAEKYKEYHYYNNIWLKYKSGDYKLNVS
tara:strand:+ start:135 stop:404 length:270 start_codon:yes stop_codon:yes gene_type:complete